MDSLTILTSAAVGTLVGTGLTLFGQIFERKARRRELVIKEAIALAIRRTDRVLQIAKEHGRNVTLRDDISVAAEYVIEIDSLIDSGRLSDAFKKREAESLAKTS